jgi:hypothetical protein
VRRVGYFLAGFASGWVVRSTVDSSGEVPVRLMAAIFGGAERIRRTIAMERERLEDLVAEGRARYETKRDRKTAESGTIDQDSSDDARGPRAVPSKTGSRAA